NVDADAGYLHARGSKNVSLPLGGSGSSSGGSSGSGTTPKAKAQSQAASTSGGGGENDSAFDNQMTPFGEGGLPGVDSDLYQAGFDATWEIDVFGGTRRRVQAADAQTQAAVETQRGLIITLLPETARNYLELRGTQERLGIAQKYLSAQKEILELT